MVMRVGNSLEGRDEPIRRTGGLQARGAYKEVPRASLGSPEELPGVYPSKG